MMKSASPRRSVLVVGAGAAGVGAARWLIDNVAELQNRSDQSHFELEVNIVEARNRTGGRVFTYNDDGSAANGVLDLGASWVHDPYRNPFTIFALNMGLKLVETDFEEALVTDLAGKRWSDAVLEKCDKTFEKVLFTTAAQARKNALHHRSIDEVLSSQLDIKDPVIQQLLSEIEFELGCPLRDCSACECIDADWLGALNDGADQAYRRLPKFYQSCNDLVLPSSFGELFAGLESGAALDGTELQHGLRDEDGNIMRLPLPVKFNEEVVSIDQSSVPGKAMVTVKRYACPFVDPVHDTRTPAAIGAVAAPYTGRVDGGAAFETVQYTVDAVIVTAPIGVLQAGAIAFTPPLSPAKQNIIDNTGFGNVVKVVLEFSQVFWPTHVAILCIADAALANPAQRGLLTYFLNGHFVAGKKVLVGYALGDAAAAVDQMSDAELEALVMQRVRALALPGRRVPAAPARVVRSRWAADPYARGVYSCWRPRNLPGARKELARPEGCVWFAGEAVQESSMLSSSVHGAWLSGVEQAAAVCAHLGVPCVLPTALQR